MSCSFRTGSFSLEGELFVGSNNAKYIKKKKKNLQNTARFDTEQTNVCVIEPYWTHIKY